MKRAFYWLIPHPLLTLILTITWVLLQNELSAGMLVFGFILGILIPWMTSVWWPDTPKSFHPLRMVSYSFVVIWDIIVANIEVAWIVLTVPANKLKPAWIVVPLRLRQPEAITMLAGTITLTPGTVSADLSDQGRCLLVHVLHTEDPDSIRDDIINRYEARLLEIFA
ncbi:Na+/H+ antiporter subunit E [Yoonia litorea]|uniref:Multisubunit potassium/proton antiporter, PhaE subunit n=1 Tax=Yoonia litorea TaxID=1123755 RepID=A0A1I6MIH9_9RHOB|nr:Na+/H+ antiporter subunit E [Yoonia litorea]SFS15494.1 multisubunit potassium/proton antiporter, PhaE subunit [Yoonia litorea]